MKVLAIIVSSSEALQMKSQTGLVRKTGTDMGLRGANPDSSTPTDPRWAAFFLTGETDFLFSPGLVFVTVATVN